MADITHSHYFEYISMAIALHYMDDYYTCPESISDVNSTLFGNWTNPFGNFENQQILYEIYKIDIQEKAFKPENLIVVDNSWHRVPKPIDGKPRCVILWAQNSPWDTNPTEAKIISKFNKRMSFTLTQFISLVQQYLMLKNLQSLLVNASKS
jgi:hypothetical protein